MNVQNVVSSLDEAEAIIIGLRKKLLSGDAEMFYLEETLQKVVKKLCKAYHSGMISDPIGVALERDGQEMYDALNSLAPQILPGSESVLRKIHLKSI